MSSWISSLKTSIQNAVQTAIREVPNLPTRIKSTVANTVRNAINRVTGMFAETMPQPEAIREAAPPSTTLPVIPRRPPPPANIRPRSRPLRNGTVIWDANNPINATPVREGNLLVPINLVPERTGFPNLPEVADYVDLTSVEPVPNEPVHFVVEHVYSLNSDNFGVGTWGYDITFPAEEIHELGDIEEVSNALEISFQSVLNQVRQEQNLQPNDLIYMRIDGFGYLKFSFWKVKELTGRKFMEMVEEQLMSWMAVPTHSEGGLNLIVTTIKLPSGRGRNLYKASEIIGIQNKKSVAFVYNSDSLCGARAITLAWYWKIGLAIKSEGEPNKITSFNNFWKNISRHDQNSSTQTECAQHLYKLINKPFEEATTLEDIQKWEKILNINIKIVEYSNNNQVSYKGSLSKAKSIYIFHYQNHFAAIKDIAAFYGYEKYCEDCEKQYQSNVFHDCEANPQCNICHQQGVNHFKERDSLPKNDPRKYDPWIDCTECNRKFPSNECYNFHISSNYCSEKQNCPHCKAKLTGKKKIKEHECGKVICKICHKQVDPFTHLCFMQKPPDQPVSEKYGFYDFEARQDNPNRQHIPNLAVAQYFDGQEFVFNHGDNTLIIFCQWLLNRAHQGYTFLAHNMKGYDGMFILQYCYSNNLTPFVIYNGSKAIFISIPQLNIKLIDSFSFIASPLSDFPGMFGLTETKKGFFPHLFNTLANQNYIGPYPDVNYYEPNRMSIKKREEFFKWYESVKDQPFDFQKEFLEYCRSDVDILRRSCLSFRENYLKITENKVDPFQSVTIASACMRAYQTLFMPENTIGIIKNDNVKKDKFSRKSIVCLEYIQHNNPGTRIQHALNGGEKIIQIKENGRNYSYKVDGFVEPNTILQFDGCYWHGCPTCYRDTDINRTKSGKKNVTMKELHTQTEEIRNRMKKHGYNVITIKECEWEKTVKTPQFKAWYDTFDQKKIIGALNPRKAFYGGRTDTIKLFHKCSENEKIRYIDVVSLYPYINKYGHYPVGHPYIIREPKVEDTDEDDTDISNYQGVIYCDILPPRKLYHPLLPLKINNKLNFVLCHTCAINEQQSTCQHSDEERCLRGSWTHFELLKAVEIGYQVKKIHEVHHFEQFTTDLFKNYVNTFLKAKIEKSGWPLIQKGDKMIQMNDEDKQAYIQEVFQREGIIIDAQNVEKNAGMRQVAKICLNSLWGKFGQRQNQPKTIYIQNRDELIRYALDNHIIIQNLEIINTEDLIELTYISKEESVEESDKVNVYLSIFTSSQARLKLYEALENLQERVLYYDTDSVIYIDDGSPTNITVGDFLGCFKDELDGHWITEFVSGGPKNYAYITDNGKAVCKIKGFTLNYENSQKLNMKTMLSMMENTKRERAEDFKEVSEEDKQTIIRGTFIRLENQFSIERDQRTKQVTTEYTSKQYSFECNKRIIDFETYKTYPYGY
jgi:G:T-mismatch repair DNA endonuclease (very short patch repair protein)